MLNRQGRHYAARFPAELATSFAFTGRLGIEYVFTFDRNFTEYGRLAAPHRLEAASTCAVPRTRT
jgi:hypothetical protein